MATTITLNAIRSRICYFVTPDDVIDKEYLATMYQKDQALVEFSAVPDSYKYKIATGARAYIYEMATDTEEGHWKSITGYGIEGGPFSDNVTYNTKPNRALYSFGSAPMIEGSMEWEKTLTYVTWPYSKYADYISKSVELITKNGASFSIGHPLEDHGIAYIYLMGSGYEPYLEIDFSDDDSYLQVSSVSPSSGYIPKTMANTFSWGTEKAYGCYGDISVSDTKIRYKQEETGVETEIDCGSATSYTFAANTFTSDSVYWQVEITDSTGHTYTSDWATLSTVEALSTATIVSPKSTVLDGSIDNVFSWNHIIDTSTEQTGADLQISEDGSTWSTLATVTDSTQYTTIAANSIPSGTYYWRVRTYNTDDAAGEWSDLAQFIVVAAPGKPSVSATATPRPDITWQATGQQGYEVSVLSDGTESYNSGTIYGVTKAMKLPSILPDGTYTIRVRVQNTYGLWSGYGTTMITVSNVALDDITLQAAGSEFAELVWTTSGTFDRFVVYRDDNPIAITTENSYIDYSSIGDTIYYIIGLVSTSDNYSKSNSYSATIAPKYLTLISDDQVISLPNSDQEIREIGSSYSREVSRYYVYGSNYPIEETAENDTKQITFSVAFSRGSNNSVIKDLFGKTVIVKTPGLEMATGTLSSIARVESLFYIVYSCTVTQIQTEETVAL